MLRAMKSRPGIFAARPGVRSWALGGVLLAACGWPRGLPDTAAPGRGPGGALYPDLALPGATADDGRHDAAVIVAIEDYERMGERVGARAMAAAWYRYFRGSRGMRSRRIALLRDGEATPRRIARAIEAARFRSHRRGTLWFVFIGHISSAAPGAFGDLWLRGGDGRSVADDGHSFPIARVLDRAAYGTHPRAVAVLDGCWTGGRPAEGLSGTGTPPTPPFRHTGRVDDAWFMKSSGTGSKASLAALSDLERVLVDSARSRREPSDVAIYSAGIGGSCVERLPGTGFPALSYLVLGALRGWADGNGDGVVSSVEVLEQVTVMLRAGADEASSSRPRPSLYGADIALAGGVAEAGPTLAQMRWRGRAPVTAAQLLAEPVLWAKDRMVRVDRGGFRMGCPRRGDPECERDERPPVRRGAASPGARRRRPAAGRTSTGVASTRGRSGAAPTARPRRACTTSRVTSPSGCSTGTIERRIGAHFGTIPRGPSRAWSGASVGAAIMITRRCCGRRIATV